MTPHEIPGCANPECPRYRSNRDVFMLHEDAKAIIFQCRVCHGDQICTKDEYSRFVRRRRMEQGPVHPSQMARR
jgi:hypothetical protein